MIKTKQKYLNFHGFTSCNQRSQIIKRMLIEKSTRGLEGIENSDAQVSAPCVHNIFLADFFAIAKKLMLFCNFSVLICRVSVGKMLDVLNTMKYARHIE
jgi:hypothetical protein